MIQEKQQPQRGTAGNDDSGSNEEGDFVLLEQHFAAAAAVDVSKKEEQMQPRKVGVNWPNSNGTMNIENVLNELKLTMVALQVQHE
jgi:hypothetical protein